MTVGKESWLWPQIWAHRQKTPWNTSKWDDPWKQKAAYFPKGKSAILTYVQGQAGSLQCLMIINQTGPSITEKISLWAHPWKIIYIRLSEVRRPTLFHGLGSQTAQKKGERKVSTNIRFLTEVNLSPSFPMMVDYTLDLWAKVSPSSFKFASWWVFYTSKKMSNLTRLDNGRVSPQTEHDGKEMWTLPHKETTISQRHDGHGQNVRINTYRT